MKFNKKNKIFALLCISLLLIININSIFAEVVDQKSLEDLNYNNWVIEKDQNICKEYNVGTLSTTKNSTNVFEMIIDNYIPVNKDVNFTIYFNDIKEKEINGKEIVKKNIIKLYNLKEKNNKVKICVNNKFLPKIVISKDSKIGTHLLTEIREENFYQKIPKYVEEGNLIPIEVFVENTGYAPIDIKLENANDRYVLNSNLEQVSGDATYKGPISPAQKINIKYYVKADRNANFISPRAKLTYTNEFGQNIELVTKSKVIDIKEKEIYLESYIDVPRINNIKEKIKGTLILRNISNENIEDVFITSNLERGKINLILEEELDLKKKDVIEVPFTIKAYKENNTNLSFEIQYKVNNKEIKTSSSIIDLNFKEEKDYTSQIIGSLILIFIICYFWIIKIK